MLRRPQQLPKAGLGEGLSASIKAIGYTLKTPSLLFYVFLAVLINGIIMGALLWWGWSFLDPMFVWLNQSNSDSGMWGWFLRQMLSFGTLLKILIGIVILYFLTPTLFPILMNLNPLTAILLTRMFEITFQQKTGQPLPQFHPFAKGLALSLWAEVRKLIASIILFAFAFLFGLIPVIGAVVGPILLLLIGIQFAGWAYVTPYYEALGYNYSQQKEAMRHQRMVIWGLGAIAMLPGLNLIALFTGSVGGALFTAKHHSSLEH